MPAPDTTSPEPGDTPGASSRPLLFIFLVVTIDMMGVGLAFPLLPKLIQNIGDFSISEAAYYNGGIAVLYALAQFAFSPFVGNLSDAYGRRPVLLIAQSGLALDYFLMALAPNLWWIAAARLVSGMFGATVSTASAYVADVSTAENRAKNFGFIGMAFGLGFVIGPVLGGVLGEIDIHLPFFVSGALVTLNVIFGYFVLPESLPRENRRPMAGWRQSNPFSALRLLTRLPRLTPFLICFFLVFMAQRGLESIWVLYADFRFDWGIREAAFSLAFVGLMYIIVQGILVGRVVSRFGESRVISAGYLLASISLFSFALVDHGLLGLPLVGTFILGAALAEPALKSLAAQVVASNQQGLLQGAIASVNSLVIIIAPAFANLVLAHVSGPAPLAPVPGAWFLLGSGLFLLAFFVFRRARASL
ncbi:MAG: MFS transporter [Hoeflea sp.]|uniref:MFS transporter n=1 Tax=Hoeflea sp. TaxID=1940281 RepID=UPI001E158557|nr:MFS transporter [Hoeflea sp.]MBU4529789.1 MFS transporter [Alphaproteobacteria bacterium]MBU4543350.1 MFS transporter [Alphaproteobacteria bacterium]MBU4552537.1 MFS transporter [Alphaproteobacteria bacterium]MBV1723553.1 MFS transporter [Hoeflea sp.]MBV1763002.1 MFS transporter [Hoeflea sp.]